MSAQPNRSPHVQSFGGRLIRSEVRDAAAAVTRLRESLGREPSMAQIAAALGCAIRSAERRYDKALEYGVLAAPEREAPRRLVVIAPRKLPPDVEPGHMVPADGDRDESCRRYETCLTAHALAYVSAPASCPARCRWREARRVSAVQYMHTACAAGARAGS